MNIEKGKKNKRFDSNRRVLRKGESQRKNGTYDYRWVGPDGVRHAVYAPTLEELRELEKEIVIDEHDGIKTETKKLTVNNVFDTWCDLKRGLKDNTFKNYLYMYNNYVRDSFGKNRIADVKKSDVKRFYNTLADERMLSISTIDTIHNVLHQVFDLAVDDNCIRSNPTDKMLKELKQAHDFEIKERKALTADEQRLFLDFLKRTPQYNHWYPLFAVMFGSGMRIGEVSGLRWCDIDLEEGIIDINHTLVYYSTGKGKKCKFAINTPKTKKGYRKIPMMDFVKEAFLLEKANQDETGVNCQVTIDCYTDFIFVNRFGSVQHYGTVNKAIRRIVRDYNDEALLKEENPVLIPNFSCHNLRHTFATRLCEADMNLKVIQDVLGHKEVKTTLEIYTHVTEAKKRQEVNALETMFAWT